MPPRGRRSLPSRRCSRARRSWPPGPTPGCRYRCSSSWRRPATIRSSASRPARPMRLRAAAALLLGLGAGTGLLACGGSADQAPPAPAGAITAGSSIGKGSIAGRVLFRGTPPARRPIAMSGEASCHKPDGGALSEDLIVNPDGTLRNVYVHVVSGLGSRVFAPPAPPAEVDQKGCLFVPHLLAVQTNQIILFKNSDPAVHNVHARATQNVAFNVSMSGQGRTA